MKQPFLRGFGALAAALRSIVARLPLPQTDRARSQPLLDQRAVAGPVPWVIAIMTTLTVIAAAGGMALGDIAKGAQAEIAGGATVQIAGVPDEVAARQAQAVVAVLRDDPGVKEVRRLSAAERAALVEPWLGHSADDVPADFALPELIEVRLRAGDGDAAIDRLARSIAKVAPGAKINSDSEWLRPVGRAVSALQWLAAGLVLLLILATISAVLLASRSALIANRHTIEIMHLLGAEDEQLAGMFRRTAMIGAGVGGGAGFAVAVALILILSGPLQALGTAGGPVGGGGGGLGVLEWGALALLPIGGALLAAETARRAVLFTLRRMA